jgi:hypothetical protein
MGIPEFDEVEKADHSHQGDDGPNETIDTLWKKRSEDDVAYQRQAQLTWWTLMGWDCLRRVADPT